MSDCGECNGIAHENLDLRVEVTDLKQKLGDSELQNGRYRDALEEIKRIGFRANPYDNCATIAQDALAATGKRNQEGA